MRDPKMARAEWNGAVIAEGDTFEVVEGNVYFPRDAVNAALLEESDTVTRCPWKGQAHYYHVTVDGQTNRDAAWYYPDPSEAARNIEDHIAFWRGVKVTR